MKVNSPDLSSELQGYSRRLEADLWGKCVSRGLLAGEVLPSSPDIDDAFVSLSPDYLADAIKEFNAYPEVVFAWAGFLGSAVAYLWDKDWERYSPGSYAFYRGERGYDYMDEHILYDIIGYGQDSEEAKTLLEDMRYLSGHALSFLLHDGLESGTLQAYRGVVLTVEVMYRFGAALMLWRLGYRMHSHSF